MLIQSGPAQMGGQTVRQKNANSAVGLAAASEAPSGS